MKALAVFGTVATATLLLSCTSTVASVQLQPERNSVLHRGQIAAFRLPSGSQYSIGSAGTALVPIKQERQGGDTIYWYRAAETGDHTLVATPRDPGPDGCVSCVTVHYFVKVIQ